MITTVVLLENVVEGVPSGNYDGSSQDWASDAVPAANYYRGRGSVQTFLIRVSGFVGTIRLEASLDSLSDSATWFEIYEFGPYVMPITDYHPASITGNFVWLRARVEDFEAGTIDLVSVTY